MSRRPRVLVAHDVLASSVVARHDPAHPMVPRLAELEEIATDAHAVVSALLSLGYDAALLPLGRDVRALARLEREPPDLVVDLCDTLAGRGDLALALPAFCELAGIPVAGAASAGKALSKRKHDVKAALCRAGVPTPRYQVVDSAAGIAAFTLELEPPVIVKPAAEHASIGIGQASLAWDARGVAARARWLFERGMGPVLVEEYVDGSEGDILLAGDPPRCFAAVSCDFSFLPEGYPRIRTFDVKWFGDPAAAGERPPPEPRLRDAVPVRAPAAAPSATDLPAIAHAAFQAGGCRDWGRIDFRVDAGGVPLVIDVTPNAYLAPISSAASSAAGAGVDYPGLLRIIVEGTLARRPS
jgi:D-alanine-D-alanine ligase